MKSNGDIHRELKKVDSPHGSILPSSRRTSQRVNELCASPHIQIDAHSRQVDMFTTSRQQESSDSRFVVDTDKSLQQSRAESPLGII